MQYTTLYKKKIYIINYLLHYSPNKLQQSRNVYICTTYTIFQRNERVATSITC